MTTTNQDTIKAAAQRMCSIFGANGVKVKHSLMLEALATGFGLDNWRTIKAIVDTPRASTKKAVTKKSAPPLGTMQEWSVEAIYKENNQQYGSDCYGRTSLEAAYDALMERLTDFGLELNIVTVFNVDRSEVLSPNFITEIELVDNREALTRLLTAAKLVPDLAPAAALCVQWLEAVLREYPEEDKLTELTDSCAFDFERPGVKDLGTICLHSDMRPSQALTLLCEQTERGYQSLMKMEATAPEVAAAVYQIRAMVSHFEGNLDDTSVSSIVDMELTILVQ